MAYSNSDSLDNSRDLFGDDDVHAEYASIDGNDEEEDIFTGVFEYLERQAYVTQSCPPVVAAARSDFTEVDESHASNPDPAASNDVQAEGRTETSGFICPFCESVQDSENSIQVHLEFAHPEMKKTEEKEYKALSEGQDPSGGIALYCAYCEMVVGDCLDLGDHILAAHNEGSGFPGPSDPFCPVCQLMLPSQRELSDHLDAHLVEISNRRDELQCPMCPFISRDNDLMMSHVDAHFESQTAEEVGQTYLQLLQTVSSSASQSQQRKPQSKKDSYQNQYRRNLERSVVNGELSTSDYHEMMAAMRRSNRLGIDEGHSRVEGIFEKITSAVEQSPLDFTRNFFLCDPVDFYCGSFGDKGWGCGFRNLQMMLSCLAKIPSYARRIFPGGYTEMPSVCELQKMIEKAWRKGFDPEGCNQLGGRLVNTQKWIGATEIVALLSSFGIKCKLSDFTLPSATDGTHPRLLEWVHDYFVLHSAHKPPLYLQHQGHSRTIIGIEDGLNDRKRLIMFDPGTPYHCVASLAQNLRDRKELRPFLRPQWAFKAKQYQIVAVTGFLTQAEYEASKTLFSTQVS